MLSTDLDRAGGSLKSLRELLTAQVMGEPGNSREQPEAYRSWHSSSALSLPGRGP
jgi:hypothetical protein